MTGLTVSAPRAARIGRRGRGFTRLWAAVGVSNLGDGVASAALPLLAAALTRDAALVAGLAIAQRLPWLLVALPAGVIVDRSDRRSLMWRTDAFRGLALAAFGLLVALDQGSLALLYGLAFALGVAETLFDTAYRSLLPSLVAGEELERANARLYGPRSSPTASPDRPSAASSSRRPRARHSSWTPARSCSPPSPCSRSAAASVRPPGVRERHPSGSRSARGFAGSPPIAS